MRGKQSFHYHPFTSRFSFPLQTCHNTEDVSERISTCKGKSESLDEIYFHSRNEISDESSRNSSGSNKCEQKSGSAESKALEKRWIRAFLGCRSSEVQMLPLEASLPQFRSTADYSEKQPLLLVPARLCVTLPEPDSGHGKGPIFPLGLPGDRFQRGMWCLRAAEPISLVILWMGPFPVLLVTARPQLAFISSKLLRLKRRTQEEFIS